MLTAINKCNYNKNSSADEIANVNFVYVDIGQVEYSTRHRQRVSVDHRYRNKEFVILTPSLLVIPCEYPLWAKFRSQKASVLAVMAEALLNENFQNRRFLKGCVTLNANCRQMGTSPSIGLWTVG